MDKHYHIHEDDTIFTNKPTSSPLSPPCIIIRQTSHEHLSPYRSYYHYWSWKYRGKMGTQDQIGWILDKNQGLNLPPIAILQGLKYKLTLCLLYYCEGLPAFG